MQLSSRPLLLGLVLGTVFAVGCAGGPPRKATPPTRRLEDSALRREKFVILGARDEWHEAPPVIDGLKRIGGVVDCFVDETDGKFVVVYNPQRTHRDKIRLKLLEIGEELGRDPWEPIFDDR